MIKVGIDLSTTNTGIVVIDENDNYLMRLERFWKNDYWESYWQIDQVANWLFTTYDHKDMVIGIELANFKNAKLTSKFNLLAGMIMGIFYESCNRYGTTRFKLFNANEWHRLIGITSRNKREECKYLARKFAREHGMGNALKLKDGSTFKLEWKTIEKTYYEYGEKITKTTRVSNYKNENFILSDDITDAYCIAYLLPQLRDNQQITAEVKQKRANDKKTYKAEMRKRLLDANKRARLNEIIKRYEILQASGKRLTKAQQNAYEKAKRGLENEK